MRTLKLSVFAVASVVGMSSFAQAASWNAVAHAIWKDHGRVRVAVGYSGTQPSEARARAVALEECRASGGEGCVVQGAWDYGCVYITTGSAVNRAGWGSGDSVAQALQKCSEQGLECKEPIGGCVD